MTTPTILVLDSGMGGLSVLQNIQITLPNARFIYCFDNAFFPYSEKPIELIRQRFFEIISSINEQFKIDLVVVACNTASTVVLDFLRQKFTQPIVGVVPAIKPACEISQTKTIGLLATCNTVKSNYVDKLIEKYAKGCKVLKLGSTDLVNIAETKQATGELNLDAKAKITAILTPWFNQNLDAIVLGCTHFIFIKEEIAKLFPKVHLIDSGDAVAQRVKFLLLAKLNNSVNSQPNLVFCTKEPINHHLLANRLLKFSLTNLSVLPNLN